MLSKIKLLSLAKISNILKILNLDMITAKSLARKTVTLSDGTVVGKLYNILVDLKTGQILNLLVNPSKDIPYLKKEDNLYVIPFDSVISISDYIVVDKRKLKSE